MCYRSPHVKDPTTAGRNFTDFYQRYELLLDKVSPLHCRWLSSGEATDFKRDKQKGWQGVGGGGGELRGGRRGGSPHISAQLEY